MGRTAGEFAKSATPVIQAEVERSSDSALESADAQLAAFALPEAPELMQIYYY